MIIVFFILPLFACVFFVDLYFSIFTFCWTTWCNLWLINANVEHKDDPIQFRPLNFQLWIKSYHNAKIIFILKCKKCFWPKSCFPHLQAAAKLNPSEEINLFKKTNYLKVATLVWKLQLSWKKFFKNRPQFSSIYLCTAYDTDKILLGHLQAYFWFFEQKLHCLQQINMKNT